MVLSSVQLQKVSVTLRFRRLQCLVLRSVLSVFIELRSEECVCSYYGLRVCSQTNKLKEFFRFFRKHPARPFMSESQGGGLLPTHFLIFQAKRQQYLRRNLVLWIQLLKIRRKTHVSTDPAQQNRTIWKES